MRSTERLPVAKANRVPGRASSAVRLFVLGNDDQLFRLPKARYGRMVRQPAVNPVASLSNQRVRFAEAIVELQSSKAVRVVRLMFWYAAFDERGVLDTATLGRQSVAALDALLERLLPGERPAADPVLKASARFIALGGMWRPSAAQRAEITDAALGRRPCALLHN